MLVVSVLFFFGSLRRTRIDWDVAAPVTGLSTGLLSISRIWCAIC